MHLCSVYTKRHGTAGDRPVHAGHTIQAGELFNRDGTLSKIQPDDIDCGEWCGQYDEAAPVRRNCGTRSGFRSHKDRKEPVCQACGDANARYERERRELRHALKASKGSKINE